MVITLTDFTKLIKKSRKCMNNFLFIHILTIFKYTTRITQCLLKFEVLINA